MLGRIQKRLRQLSFATNRRDPVSGFVVPREPSAERIGKHGASWVIPRGSLDPDAVCYLVGAGEDISFDEGVSLRYGCVVHVFDPTPRAIAHVAELKRSAESEGFDTARRDAIRRIEFNAIGVWKADETLRFFAPQNPKHVSHSVLNLQSTGSYFEAGCLSLGSLMRKLGHAAIDLLKLDIEGAECEVIESMVNAQIRPRIICVEFDELIQPLDLGAVGRVRRAVELLAVSGYRIYHIDWPANYTFVLSRPVSPIGEIHSL